jgi:hypothetical protein
MLSYLGAVELGKGWAAFSARDNLWRMCKRETFQEIGHLKGASLEWIFNSALMKRLFSLPSSKRVDVEFYDAKSYPIRRLHELREELWTPGGLYPYLNNAKYVIHIYDPSFWPIYQPSIHEIAYINPITAQNIQKYQEFTNDDLVSGRIKLYRNINPKEAKLDSEGRCKDSINQNSLNFKGDWGKMRTTPFIPFDKDGEPAGLSANIEPSRLPNIYINTKIYRIISLPSKLIIKQSPIKNVQGEIVDMGHCVIWPVNRNITKEDYVISLRGMTYTNG